MIIFIRSLLGNIWLYGTLAVCVIFMCLVGLFIPQRWLVAFASYVMVPAARWGLNIFGGIKVEKRGLQNLIQDKAIYAIKHESALDTYSLTNNITRGTLILKKELMYIPIFGWVAKMYGLIPVDRSAGATAMKKMLKEAKQKVEQNRPIIIFPEGHRVQAGTSLKYKPGFYFMAQNLNVPIIPVALNTGLFWPRNSFIHLPGKPVIEFMEPMYITKDTDKDKFIKELQDKIEAKCEELNQEALQKYPYVRKNYAGAKAEKA